MRLGIAKFENFVFYLSLRSPFLVSLTNVEDRMRLGIVKFENFVFYLSLRSPFLVSLTNVEDRMRLGIVKFENFVFYLSLRSPFTIFAKQQDGLSLTIYCQRKVRATQGTILLNGKLSARVE